MVPFTKTIVFCCQMQISGAQHPGAPQGLRANASYEERLEGISAGIGVLAPGPGLEAAKGARFQDEWVFLQLEIVRQGEIAENDMCHQKIIDKWYCLLFFLSEVSECPAKKKT